MEEVWKDIKGYEGLYQISNLGLVRSLDRYIERRKTGFSGRAGSYYSKGKMVAITDNGNGYKLVSLSKKGRKNHYVHRLVADHFLKKPKGCDYVNHLDGVKSNNKASNLEWITQSENNKHAFRIGLKDRNRSRASIKVLDTQTNKVFGTIKEASEYFDIKYGLLKEALNRDAPIRRNPIYSRLKKID